MKKVSEEFERAVKSAFMGMYQQGSVTDAIVTKVLGDRVNELNSNEQYVLRFSLEEMLENAVNDYAPFNFDTPDAGEDLEYMFGIRVTTEDEMEAFWENYEIEEEYVVGYFDNFDGEPGIWEEIFEDVKTTTAKIQNHMIEEAKKALERITASATPYEQLTESQRNIRDISNSFDLGW